MKLIKGVFNNYIELCGDRLGHDDRSIACGLCKIFDLPVYIVSIEKGENIQDKIERHFGCPTPFGYRKVMRIVKKAEKFRRPVVILIDTMGAYCDIDSELNGQSEAISECLKTMAGLNTYNIAIITGEAESGGALALALCNEVWMLEHAVYSVISPECCSIILWNTKNFASLAAEKLDITAEKALANGMIDRIIKNHNSFDKTCTEIQLQLYSLVKQYYNDTQKDWVELRYNRFRKY